MVDVVLYVQDKRVDLKTDPQLLVAPILALVTRAEAAAATVNGIRQDAGAARRALEAILAVPIAMPIDGNPNNLSSDAVAPADQGTIKLLIAQTNTGATNISIGGVFYRIARPGTGAAMAAGDLPAGRVVTLQRSNAGAGWFLTAGTDLRLPSAADLAAVGASATGAQASAVAVRAALEALVGVPVAVVSADNPNTITVSGAAVANGGSFEALIVAANTGKVTISKGGVTMRLVVNPGTGAEAAGGELVPGTIRSFTRSDGGAAYILGASRLPTFNATPPTPSPVGTYDSEIFYRPWGDVQPGGVMNPIGRDWVFIGSSNAADGYVANGYRPDQVVKAEAEELLPGTGITINTDLRATQGAPWSDAGRQLGLSAPFMAGTAKFVLCFFWMNDIRTINYHDYNGVKAMLDAMSGTVDYIRSKGAEPVVSFGFTPDPRANPEVATQKALDPFYFSDNPGRGSSFSPVKAAPVDPVADMRPAATAADFMTFRDWTGGGVKRTGFKRLWHFNRDARIVATQKGVIGLDLEWSGYRLALEKVPDLGPDLNQWFDPTNVLHPLPAWYDQTVSPVLRSFVRGQASGRTDIRVYRGDEW